MGASYKAIQVTAPGKPRAAELTVPEPPPGHVRVRVEACGICHSDVLRIEGGFPRLSLPRVPGHEVTGRIDALGRDVQQWQVGQRVGVGFLGGHCGVCWPLKASAAPRSSVCKS